MTELKYNKPITRENLDIYEYEKKFRLAERFGGYNDHYHQRRDKNYQKEFKKLLEDPTIFSYLFFQIDGKPLKLYPYQDVIINDKHRYKIFRAANQIGKSLLLDIKAAYNLIMDHGHAHNEVIVSKSLPQSTFQMRRVKSILNTAKHINWKEEKGDSDSMSVISCDIKDPKTDKVKYTNLCICVPPTESLLGYDVHEMNLDEFEYWECDLKYFFNQIAQPRTYTTKGKITIFSNPNGQDNFAAELEEQVLLNGEKKWHTYVFNYLDKPGNTQEEYDQLKYELSRQEFESTVAAIRSISDRNYFTPEEIDKSYDKNLKDIDMVGKQPFFFLDVGAKHDQSCLVGGYVDYEKDSDFAHIYISLIHLYPQGYPLTRVAGVPNVDVSDGWHFEKSVKEYLDEWTTGGTVPVFGFDVTGNEGMRALFDSIDIQAIDVTFSGPNKSGFYQRFKYHMEKGLLHRIKHKEWEKQARKLIVTKGVRGYLLVNSGLSGTTEAARAKRIPDDCMDATAGFIYLANPSDNVPATLKII